MKISAILFLFSISINCCIAQYDHQNIYLLGRYYDSTVVAEPVYGIKYQACWGWADSIGREYGIIGSSSGTYIVNVTNPLSPVYCDYVYHHRTNMIWHEFKTYGNLLYIISDDQHTGLQIADLSYLPDSVHLIYDDTLLVRNAHTSFIDRNKLYLGSVSEQLQYSSMNVYSLANPAMPLLLHRLSDDYPNIGQVHDMYVSNDTVFASCGYDGLFIFRYDTIANRFIELSSLQDNTNVYNHSSVLSPDHKYLYMCEEVPDGQPVKIINLTDISNPFVDTTFYSHSGATPHNPSIKGNFLILAYYMDGVYIYDITNPAVPVYRGFFDSYPYNTPGSYPQPAYGGCWSTYADLPSGILIDGDMQSGLFTLDISSVIGVDEISNHNIGVYPNPTSNYLTIATNIKSEIKIFDGLGRKLISIKSTENKTKVDVTDLLPGMYYVTVSDQGKSINSKIIKE